MIRVAAVAVLGLLAGCCSALADELPNILWLTSEDNGPHLGCYGDDVAITPHLDALASRGLMYTNASSNAPVCAPARTTIITGLYPPSTGAEHMRSEVRLPAEFRMFPQLLRKAGYYCTNNHKEDYNVQKPGRVWDESNRNAHWRNRAPGQPFFAVFNHPISHESQIRNPIRDEDRVHDPAQVRVPPYHPDTPEVRRDWAQYYDRLTMMDAQVGRKLQELEDAGLAEDTIIFYFSDHGSGMPRNKRWLYGSGLDVPLIVYFPPKWRHLAPDEYAPGGKSDRLVSFIDLAPTVLSIAGIEPPAWMQGGAFAGQWRTAEPTYSYGFRARMDARYDLSRSVRDKRYKYIRNYMPHRAQGQYLAYMFETPTTRVWKRLHEASQLNEAQSHFWREKPFEELYDLEADPDELHNLADSPAHGDVLRRMRGAHRDWELRIRDVMFLCEWEMHERSRGSTPYAMGRDASRYDLESVLAAADLASRARERELPHVVDLLRDEDSAVRYWGATGLLIQGARGVRGNRQTLVAALRDESPAVQIAAAEALGRFGNDDERRQALEVLTAHVKPGSEYFLAVAAWNALDMMDDGARPALDELRSTPVEFPGISSRYDGYPQRIKTKLLSDLETN